MKLSIIIPCYNEEKSIKANIEKVKTFLSFKKYDYEIIVVDDGSIDHTSEIANSIEGITSLRYGVNQGKGYAVNYGIKHASGDFVLFMDEDLATDLSSIDELMKYADEYDMVIGSRHFEGSKILVKQPLKRRFMGWVCRKLVNMKFHLKLDDTQCGFKGMKIEVARELASRQIIKGFAFDVEYLYFAELNNLSVKTIPVIWKDNRDSRVARGSSMKFIKDMNRIKKNKNNYLYLK